MSVAPPVRALALAATAALLAGCPSGEPSPPAPAKSLGRAAETKAAPPRVGPKLSPQKVPTWHVPVGISLPIERGKGIGPIRFGATRATIERLIGEPCEEWKQTDEGHVCRYSAQSVEFFLRDGALSRIAVHHRTRSFREQPRLEYGIFNGRFVEGAALGMLKRGVVEFLGEPTRVEASKDPDATQAVERHYYPGAVLEYDRTRSGALILAGIVLSPES